MRIMIWHVALLAGLVAVIVASVGEAKLPSARVVERVRAVNSRGAHLAIVVPTAFQMEPLLEASVFTTSMRFPYIDINGRRFHIGSIENHNVIVVMTGLSMLNAGITTQILLDFFNISGVLHYGISGNINDQLNIGDITVPKYWAHTGLWNWQRYGQGPNDALALEADGDFTRKIGYLPFGDYNNPTGEKDNLLNNVWFQQEEVFPVTGTPEVREHYFWVKVNPKYYEIAQKIANNVTLVSCLNSTNCLTTTPKVVMVERGVSANVYLDNAAYRDFLSSKFNASPVDMESASVALVCLTNNVPFVAIRALSNLAGGSSDANQSAIFFSLVATNAVIMLTNFIKQI